MVSGLDESGVADVATGCRGDPSGRTLLGKIGGVTVITLTLTGDVTAAGGGDTARPTVTAVLSGNLPHQNAPDADSLTITGLVVNATDTGRRDHHRDGQCDGGGRCAERRGCCSGCGWDAGDGQPCRGRSLSGTWTLNDGADDVSSIRVSVAGQPNQVVALPGGAPAVFDLPAGVLTVNANGTWSFAAKISLDQTPASDGVVHGGGGGPRRGHGFRTRTRITVTDGADARSSGTVGSDG